MNVIRIRNVLILCLLAGPFAAAQEIQRVEPPNWWTGFEHSELQLLVYGPDVGSLVPSVDYPGLGLSRTVRVDSPNYLFVYLFVTPAAEPGNVELRFAGGDTELTYDFELNSRNTDPGHVTGFSSKDVLYLLTPDRFANGDTANDTVAGMGDPLDRDDDYGRHGGDLKGISDNLDYLVDMGFTALWLNPILENRMAESSYHGYATTDFYRVDARYGTNEQYRQLVADMRSRGLGMVMDFIVNHIGTGHWWMQDLPTADWLNHQDADETQFSTHARTSNLDPYAAEVDNRGHADGWFADTMPDLNQRNPLLADYLIQNAIWWIEYLGLHGIRMDTWPYPDKHFMAEWTRRVMREYPDFNVVGEEWSENPNVVSYWQRGKVNHDGYVSELPSVFDFPVQATFRRALTTEVEWWDSPWKNLYELVGTDFLYPDPMNLVIFPDNHDMDRIYTQLDEDDDLNRMAMVFYATMRGIPQYFYGSEVLLSHMGTSSHGALRMDFPGGWAGDRKNAFTGTGLSRKERDAQAYLRKLLNWRKDKAVIHDGKFMHYAPVEKNVYAYFRYDDAEAVMVIMNRGAEAITLDMTHFSERLGDSRFANDVMTGKRYNISKNLPVEPRSVLLLEIE